MTASDSFTDAIAEALVAFGPLTIKRMFGGAGIWRDGVMFALIADDTLYLKTDAANHATFEAEGCAPFSYQKVGGQMAVMSYWRAPERLLDDPEELLVWARRAYDAAVAMRLVKPRKATKATKAVTPRNASKAAKSRKAGSPTPQPERKRPAPKGRP